MFRRAVVASLAILPMLLIAAPVHAQATSCQFILGFKTLHDMDPTDIGDCVDNQAYAANGDAIQHTAGGLLVWRKVDNWTAFTNGNMTWINGPIGLTSRLNTQRFSWEANPDGLPIADAPSVAPVSDTSGTAGMTDAQKLHYAGNMAYQLASTIWTNDVESYNEMSDVPASTLPIGASALDDANWLTQDFTVGSYAQTDASHYRFDVQAAGKVWSGPHLLSVTFHWFIVMNIDTQKGHFAGYAIE